MSVTDLSQYDDMLEEEADGELLLEQAKIYAHIGRSEEAIALLQTHIDSKPRASLHHWLYLLDIYRETNQKEPFGQYAALLHQRFNVMTPVWNDEAPSSDLASTIEAFPHIVQQLTALWGDEGNTLETQAYIEYLLTDNRDSVRAGFSMDIFQELILLNDILALRDKFDDAINP
jgi:tetratricopeptide (TPR) repeat protein